MSASPPTGGASPLALATGRLAQRVLVIFDNRLQLLLVEAQEERERLLHALWLGMAVAVFGLLAGLTFTLIVAVLFWNTSPVLALVILGAAYAAGAAACFVQLSRLQKNWQTLPGTLDQLRKDRECLEKHLG